MKKGKLSVILASLAVVAGVFLFRMMVAPPVSEAATHGGIDPAQITRMAPTNLPSFDSIYQRHTGVLDTLKAP